MENSKTIIIDKELHKRLKQEALDQDKTLQELVEEIIKDHYDTTH